MKFTVLLFALATFVLASADVQATGIMICESGDPKNWKTQKQLSDKITKEGWQVRRIKVDGRCYEVYGTTPEGQRVEAYFHPVSLEKLLVARRGEILFRK
jgi:hypothetical protein